MKKVLRTFVVTLVLVLYAGIAGIVYLAQQQPERVQQFLGCPTTSQVELQQAFDQQMTSFETQINTLTSTINQLNQTITNQINNDTPPSNTTPPSENTIEQDTAVQIPEDEQEAQEETN